jgi:hypothetical protein
MSGETVSCTSQVDIYMPLLNEGTAVIRPTKGLPLGGGQYKVLPSQGYAAALEEWQFPPGSIVACAFETHGGVEVLVARTRLS